eukprot:s4612_g1.t1
MTSLGVCADVSVENRFGAKKSALLARHMAVGHPALGAACAVVKTWAKRRGVYGQSCGFPSGLGFSCMVIFAAQRLMPPGAVEDIQEPQGEEGFDHQKMGEVDDFANVQEVYAQLQQRFSDGQKELPQLLHGIFGFYADAWTFGARTFGPGLEDFDWSRHVVSLTKSTPAPGVADTLRIQDPVQTELDLARPYMNKARSDLLRQELLEAFRQLRSGRWDDFLAKKTRRRAWLMGRGYGAREVTGQGRRVNISAAQEHLHELGRPAGVRILDLCALRENRNRRETRLLPMLNFIASSIWTRLFGHSAELLKGQDHENEYMLNDKALLVNRFISVPKDLGDVNCGAFVAGMVEGMLCSAEFTASATAHTVEEPTGTSTTILIKFEEKVMARERRSERT